MSNELTLPGFTNRSLTTAQDKVEQFSDSREVTDIFKEGTKQIVAQQMQAAKTLTAINLTTEVYDHTLKTADKFARQAFARVEGDGHNEESRAFSQALTNGVMARYNAHINGILEVGVTGMARELHKDVIVKPPKEEKAGLVPMMRELALLLATDAATYSRYVRSLLTMQAEAEATKVRVTLATRQAERELKRELKKKGASP